MKPTGKGKQQQAQRLGRICNLVLINFLYLVTALPIITVGAARMALYTCIEKMREGEPIQIYRDYFQAFGRNWKRGSLLWGVDLLALIITGSNWLFYWQASSNMKLVLLPTSILLTILVLAFHGLSYLLALRLEVASFPELMRNVCLCILGRPFRALGVALLQIAGLILLYFAPFKIWFYILCFISALPALGISLVAESIFKQVEGELADQELYLM